MEEGQGAVQPQDQPTQAATGDQPAQPAQQTTTVENRTDQQFDKLKESNKKLFEANRLLQEELLRRQQVEQQVATPVPQPQPQQQGQGVSLNQFIETDPVTGEQSVNSEKLSAALAEANQRAVRAESTVANFIQQQRVTEEERQTREAYATHPEVNPQSQSFDADVSKLTSALLLHSMMNPQDYGGATLSFKDAAAQAKQLSAKQAKEVTQKAEEAKEEIEKRMEAKENATAGATGMPGVAAQNVAASMANETDMQRLVSLTRSGYGDDATWAIAKRLTMIPHVGVPTSSQ